MGEAKRKREQTLISVLIPERGRPEMLDRLICSLLDTAGADERIEILVAIDDDDPAWTDRTPFEHSRTQYFRRSRPITLGEKLNKLAAEARGDVFWFISNDMVMETKDWPAKFRAAVDMLPNGIGVPFVHDDLHPDHAAYPIITRQTQEAVGFFMPPCYPYWFIDTHWDQVGLMLDLRFEIDVTVSAPEGRGQTHGLIDLPFWVDFFRAMAPIRMKETLQLAEAAYGRESQRFIGIANTIGDRSKAAMTRTDHLTAPGFLGQFAGKAESPPGPAYNEVKAYAERMMGDLQKMTPRRPLIALATPSGRTYEATTANCIAALAAYSTRAGVDIFLCNVQTSTITHGRNTTVQLALEHGCDKILWVDSDMKFPPETLIALLKHNKDIVGGTYNRRTPPYQTLGRMKGKMPEAGKLRSGLLEAEALPGGMLLVDMKVYKSLGWPWYFDAFKWVAPNGLDAFKAMMLDYFNAIPPQHVLDSVDGTPLGQWFMENNFDVALDAGSSDKMMSEDLAFCRKAVRAGWPIFCCLDTTFACAHIGVAEINCDRPPEPVELAEAAD